MALFTMERLVAVPRRRGLNRTHLAGWAEPSGGSTGSRDALVVQRSQEQTGISEALSLEVSRRLFLHIQGPSLLLRWSSLSFSHREKVARSAG